MIDVFDILMMTFFNQSYKFKRLSESYSNEYGDQLYNSSLKKSHQVIFSQIHTHPSSDREESSQLIKINHYLYINTCTKNDISDIFIYKKCYNITDGNND